MNQELYKKQLDKMDQGTRARWLWQSVIAQAIDDTTFTERSTEMRKSEARQVIGWLKTEDFRVVCSYAGMQPSRVRELITKTYHNSLCRVNRAKNKSENKYETLKVAI